jgi:DNA-directed RNA polymerase specialized sigma24 family protein
VSRTVTSDDVAAFHPLVAKHARIFNGRFGAEYDDLYQEGMVAVWEALSGGHHPSTTVVKNAMRDWVRRCKRAGFVYEDDPEE